MKGSMAVSQHFIVWTCDQPALNNWFLYYTLQRLKPRFERAATGSTIKTIGMPFFAEMDICHPTLSEQQRIADCLGSVDEGLAAGAAALAALKAHKAGLMQGLFPPLPPA
jgi:type I restriction enzyme, S subunit